MPSASFRKPDFSRSGKVQPRNDRFFTLFGFQVSDNRKLTPTGAFLMATHVLDHDAPGLAGRLRALNSESRRKVVVKASLFAAQRMSELNANTQALLDKMRFSGEVSPQEAISAMVLSEAADDEYFKLQEEGAPAEVWGKSFSLGRLLRGIVVGFGAAPKEDIADAIYEISKSVDNSASLFEHIASEIGPSPEIK
jgi:hypothetical protein